MEYKRSTTTKDVSKNLKRSTDDICIHILHQFYSKLFIKDGHFEPSPAPNLH